MIEIYKEGVHHLAKLDKWNYVVYDVRTLRIVGDPPTEAYEYKYYWSLRRAVRAFARRKGDVGSDAWRKALNGAKKGAEMGGYKLDRKDEWRMANGSTIKFVGTDEETVIGGDDEHRNTKEG